MKNNQIEVRKTNGDCAHYTGTVTIASYLGDRLIQKETQHNAGLAPLFEFIGSCLQGNWYEARDKRPCKLVLLTKATDEYLPGETIPENYTKGPSTPTNPDATDRPNREGSHYWSSKYALCTPVMYDTAAISATTATSSSTTYHFRVPFLNLVGGAKIKKLLLLPPMATNYQTEACAYFILETEIPIPEQGANFTIIVDWTLEFTNSQTESTTPSAN
jgi:hypothetical protein